MESTEASPFHAALAPTTATDRTELRTAGLVDADGAPTTHARDIARLAARPQVVLIAFTRADGRRIGTVFAGDGIDMVQALYAPKETCVLSAPFSIDRLVERVIRDTGYRQGSEAVVKQLDVGSVPEALGRHGGLELHSFVAGTDREQPAEAHAYFIGPAGGRVLVDAAAAEGPVRLIRLPRRTLEEIVRALVDGSAAEAGLISGARSTWEREISALRS